MSETYEPQVWRELFATLREGDTIVDIGAWVGLYTVAAAKRVGERGHVVAFEPDPVNFARLAAQAKLNAVTQNVQLVQAAVGAKNADVSFSAGNSSQSHVIDLSEASAPVVKCVRLDSYLADRQVDLVKVDVEVAEEEVIRGAVGILRDANRRPRALFIEAHPCAWKWTGASDQSLIGLLRDCGYSMSWLDGGPVERITSLAGVVARPDDDAPLVPERHSFP